MAKSVFTGKEISEDNEFVGGSSVPTAMSSLFADKRPALEAELEDGLNQEVVSLLQQAEDGSWDTSDSLQAARAFTDGMWMNKGEEVGAWIGATVYKLFGMYGSEDKTISQIKEEMLNRSEADSAAFLEERPVAATAANIAGNILSPVSLKGGQLLGQARTLRQSELARQSAMETRAVLGGRGAIGTTAKAAEDASKTARLYSGLSPKVYDIVTKTPTPLLGAGLVGAESAVIGAEGDTMGERAQNALISGGIGFTLGGTLSLAGYATNKALQSNISQEIGKGANFVNLMFTEHALAPVYQHVVAKAYGGRSLVEQQARAMVNRLPSLSALKEKGVNLKENAQKTLARAKVISSGNQEQQVAQAKRLSEDLKSELSAKNRIAKDELDTVSRQRIDDLEQSVDVNALKAAAVREADAAVNAVESSFRTEAIIKSLPTNARAGLADEIAAMAPQDALKAVRDSWSSVGFSAAKSATYPMNLASIQKNIEQLLTKNATKVALAGANGKTAATTINNYIEAMIKERAKNGVMSGEDLLQLRSEIGTVINNLSENQVATRQITKPIQQFFDDMLMSRLSKEDAASFMQDRQLWQLKSTLEDAVSNATGRGKGVQGAFTADDWIVANKTQGTAFSSVGEGALQKEAQDVNNLAAIRKELIESNALKDAEQLKQKTIQEIQAERQLLKAQQRQLKTQTDARRLEINRNFEASKKTAKDVRERADALAEESARFKQAMSTIDDDIAKIEKGVKFFQETLPKSGSVFERLFATSILASVSPTSVAVDDAMNIGLNLAVTGSGVAKGLSTEAAQRFLAGQTGFQRAGSEIAKRLDESAQKLAERTGVNYRPVAAAVVAPDAGNKKVFNEQTKRSIMGQGQLSKARIYTGLQNAGKLEALKAQDPELFKVLKAAFDAQSR